MMRLGISVEGATEREFVSRLIAPHLLKQGLIVNPIDMRGNVSLDKIRSALPALMGSFDRVSTLYDFYQFKNRGDHTIETLENAMHALVSPEQRHRFIPYVQRYEFESLLFAIPEQVVAHLGGTPKQLHAIQDAVKKSGSPELVNDSFETSPSHRMKKLFSSFDKKFHAPQIIESAGLPAIRPECPRFHAWLTQLEALAIG